MPFLYKWSYGNRVSLLLLISILCCCRPSYGQQLNPRFVHFTTNNGLSQSLIYNITQDKQGFMWFGSREGLNRFDGYEFKIYHHDPFDSTSLSNDLIDDLFTDSRGRLWIGTANGLDLYDRLHDRFIHFLVDSSHTKPVHGNYVSDIAEDKNGNLWVGTYGKGLFELSFPKGNKDSLPNHITHYHHQPGDSNSLADNFIISLFVNSGNNLWISTAHTMLQYASLEEKSVHFHFPDDYVFKKANEKSIPNGMLFDVEHAKKVQPDIILNNKGYDFYEDRSHRLWLCGQKGLFLFDNRQKMVTMFDIADWRLGLGSLFSIGAAPSNPTSTAHQLWLGADQGVGIFNTKTFALQIIKHDPGNQQSLQGGRITSIYRDQSGCMWLGSNGYGVSKFDPRSVLFPIPFFHTANHEITSTNLSIRSLFDMNNYLLIGSTDGLWKADKHSRLMKEIILNHAKVVYDIIQADSDAVWMATKNGLVLYNLRNDKLKTFLPNLNSIGLKDNRIYNLFKDDSGYIWCLTPYSFSRFDRASGSFTHYFYDREGVNQSRTPTFGDIYQNAEGNFWLGTGEGLLYFDTQKKTFDRYATIPSDTSSLSANAVRCVIADPNQPNKYLWIGTAGGGLNRLNLRTKKFIHFTEKDGLPNNTVYGILSDREGNLWMSTNKGLSKFDPATQRFQNYGVGSGLQSNEFNSCAYYKNKEGKLFFGGIAGFNAFYPDQIKENTHVPQVAFTGFRLFNKPVSVNTKNSPLKKPIAETHKIILPYKDNIISFQLAGLDYANPDKNKYAYKLSPINNAWIQMGTNRLITLSNLAPGHYTLHAKAANSDGVWNSKGTSLKLIILPPWWRSTWAYLAYLLIGITILYILRRYELKRSKLKNRLQIEQVESRKLKELDRLKSRFFANISHEFRTPLTLIIGPLEDIINGGDPGGFMDIIPEMYRNSKRLLQLINQLLDLSKLDAGTYQVNTLREDIIPFINQIVQAFSSLAQRKNINLIMKVSERLEKVLSTPAVSFYFDDDVIEKIVSNLLSNAFKFTSDGGEISLSLDVSESKSNFLELKVEDNGAGISADKLPYVFDRFYKVDDSDKRQYQGSGIGLALLKELVDLHQGTISVDSKINQGTAFYCYLPLNHKIISGAKKQVADAPHPIEIMPEAPAQSITDEQQKAAKEEAVVLVVEDQADVRKYIREKLKNNYKVIEAENGRKGLSKGFKEIPDLVVSDVMMPEMDGFELCKALKSDERTSHIPVIMLTARAEDSDKIDGLETGADAYLVKPFNSQELIVRVKKLIELRNEMRARFSGKLVVKPSEVSVNSRDQQFLEDLLSTVESHINDPGFSVDQLAAEMHMCASQLYRKLKALMDQSAQQYIRSVRMQRALDLLKKDSALVSEISWQVGFEDPGYFTKVFKKHFGCLPTEKEKFPSC